MRKACELHEMNRTCSYDAMKKDESQLKQKSQFQNVPFWPISTLGKNFNPRNTPCIPAVKIFTRLDLDQTETF